MCLTVSLRPEMFEGMRLEFAKPLNEQFALIHRFPTFLPPCSQLSIVDQHFYGKHGDSDTGLPRIQVSNSNIRIRCQRCYPKGTCQARKTTSLLSRSRVWTVAADGQNLIRRQDDWESQVKRQTDLSGKCHRNVCVGMTSTIDSPPDGKHSSREIQTLPNRCSTSISMSSSISPRLAFVSHTLFLRVRTGTAN